MKDREINEAVQFITDNLDFYAAPFIDQKKFSDWASSLNEEDKESLISLSNALQLSLELRYIENGRLIKLSQLQPYQNALIGTNTGQQNSLAGGNPTALVILLKQNEGLLNAILKQKKPMLIKKWRSENQTLMEEIKKTEERIPDKEMEERLQREHESRLKEAAALQPQIQEKENQIRADMAKQKAEAIQKLPPQDRPKEYTTPEEIEMAIKERKKDEELDKKVHMNPNLSDVLTQVRELEQGAPEKTQVQPKSKFSNSMNKIYNFFASKHQHFKEKGVGLTKEMLASTKKQFQNMKGKIKKKISPKKNKLILLDDALASNDLKNAIKEFNQIGIMNKVGKEELAAITSILNTHPDDFKKAIEKIQIVIQKMQDEVDGLSVKNNHYKSEGKHPNMEMITPDISDNLKGMSLNKYVSYKKELLDMINHSVDQISEKHNFKEKTSYTFRP